MAPAAKAVTGPAAVVVVQDLRDLMLKQTPVVELVAPDTFPRLLEQEFVMQQVVVEVLARHPQTALAPAGHALI